MLDEGEQEGLTVVGDLVGGLDGAGETEGREVDGLIDGRLEIEGNSEIEGDRVGLR